MLDSFDVMLYAMVGAALINDPTLHLSFQTNGLLGSITQLAAAAGGIVFAVIADRFGRKRALMGAILMYSIFTARVRLLADGDAARDVPRLLGLGMGGEWATGAALVSGIVSGAASRQGARASCRARGRSATASRRSSTCS